MKLLDFGVLYLQLFFCDDFYSCKLFLCILTFNLINYCILSLKMGSLIKIMVVSMSCVMTVMPLGF